MRWIGSTKTLRVQILAYALIAYGSLLVWAALSY